MESHWTNGSDFNANQNKIQTTLIEKAFSF